MAQKFSPKLETPGVCALCNLTRSAHTLRDEECPPTTFAAPVVTSTTVVEKGIRNYPIGTEATAIGGWFGNPAPLFGSVTSRGSSSSTIVADDPIRPKHYKGDLVMRIIEHFELDKDFALGNVIKYLLRAKNKAGVVDLEKAAWYLQRAIDVERKKISPGLDELLEKK